MEYKKYLEMSYVLDTYGKKTFNILYTEEQISKYLKIKDNLEIDKNYDNLPSGSTAIIINDTKLENLKIGDLIYLLNRRIIDMTVINENDTLIYKALCEYECYNLSNSIETFEVLARDIEPIYINVNYDPISFNNSVYTTFFNVKL